MISRWRFDMRTHLALTSEKTQHEEDRMRDIHVGKRGSEAGEAQLDQLRKTARFGKKLRLQQRLQIQVLLWNILRVVRHKVGRGPYLCRHQVMLMTTYKFPRWMHSTRWMVARVVTSEKCGNGTEEKMREVNRMKWLRI